MRPPEVRWSDGTKIVSPASSNLRHVSLSLSVDIICKKKVDRYTVIHVIYFHLFYFINIIIIMFAFDFLSSL